MAAILSDQLFGGSVIDGQCCPCAPYTRVCVAAETADEGLRGGDTSTSGRGTVPESGTADARRP